MKFTAIRNGFIHIKNRLYSFVILDKQITFLLIKRYKKEDYINPFNDLDFEYIEGKLLPHGKIIFINLLIKQKGLNCEIFFGTCGSIFVFDSTKDKPKIKKIIFKGKAIDKYYSPSLGMEEENFNIKKIIDGARTIKVKPFRKKCINYSGKLYNEKINFSLSTNSPETINENSTNLGNIYSLFTLEFTHEKKPKDVLKWLDIVKKFFGFIYFRNNVCFEEIIFYSNSRGEERKIGSFGYLNDDVEFVIPDNYSKTIHYDEISDTIISIFDKLTKEDLNLLCFPSNKSDSLLVTPEKYVFTCASFENLFNIVFPNYVDEDKDYKMVIDPLLDFIKSKDEEYKGKNKNARNWLDKIKGDLERQSTSCEHKFNYCFKKYEKYLSNFIEERKRYYPNDLKIDNLGSNFSSIRNKNAHGTLVQFDKEAIIAFEFGRVFIYIMFLELCKADDELIKIFISRLF